MRSRVIRHDPLRAPTRISRKPLQAAPNVPRRSQDLDWRCGSRLNSWAGETAGENALHTGYLSRPAQWIAGGHGRSWRPPLIKIKLKFKSNHCKGV